METSIFAMILDPRYKDRFLLENEWLDIIELSKKRKKSINNENIPCTSTSSNNNNKISHYRIMNPICILLYTVVFFKTTVQSYSNRTKLGTSENADAIETNID